MNVNGVQIGNRFKSGKHHTAVVVDIIAKYSIKDSVVKGHICIAKAEGLSSNEFEVPFATVRRNIIQEATA